MDKVDKGSEFIENFKYFYLPGGIMILAVLSLIAFLGIPKTMNVMTYVKLSLGIVLTCEAILFITIIYLFVVWGALGDILVPCFIFSIKRASVFMTGAFFIRKISKIQNTHNINESSKKGERNNLIKK